MAPGVEIVRKYFPELSSEQQRLFALLGPLYADWNARVNLISRKDIEHLYERHVLHSLGIAKAIDFPAGSRILDVGTGGGLPGIPLAILFPGSTFHLIDGIGKKIAAVKGIIEGLGLKNATAEQVRSEDHRGQYDFVVSRAVTELPQFVKAVKHLLPKGKSILYLKGGDIADEVLPLGRPWESTDLSQHFQEEFFATKKVLRVVM